MSKNAERRPDVGGQAVIEGVMMKSPEAIAIAVRRPNGKIVVERDLYTSPAKKHKWMGYPVIRGMVSMATMLSMGMKTIEKSTRMLGIMDEEPSKFELWLSKTLGKSVDKIVMGVAMVFAVIMSLFLFMGIPSVVGTFVNRFTTSLLLVNLVSGIARIAILIGYIYLAGLLPDMRRTFEYHGAEHKTVHCYEHDLPLTPENAQKFSTLHPRCGTSFLLLVMVIAILLGAVADQLLHLFFGIERLTYIWRLLRSLLLLPLISGVSFEALKGLAHSDNVVVRILRWPGLMLQHLTTRQPDLEQLEVAIAAFNAALYGTMPVEDDTTEDVPAHETIAKPEGNLEPQTSLD